MYVKSNWCLQIIYVYRGSEGRKEKSKPRGNISRDTPERNLFKKIVIRYRRKWEKRKRKTMRGNIEAIMRCNSVSACIRKENANSVRRGRINAK